MYAHASIGAVEVPQRHFLILGDPGAVSRVDKTVNCLRSVLAFSGCFLELNDVHWMLRSTNMLFKVSRYFYDESEFIVDSL